MTFDSTAYIEEIREWQTDMEEKLRAPDSWLTLIGLDWLEEGKNSLGTSSQSNIVFPKGTAPDNIGTLILTGDQVTFEVEAGVVATLNGNPVTRTTLESDVNRNPDIIQVGEINFHVIERSGRYGIRSKQPNSPQRVNFQGRRWWLVDRDLRIEAEIIPYEPQKMIKIPDILGNQNESAMDCQLQFTLNQQTYALDAFALPSGQFYILFHDLSCGNGSYPAGRFLVTEYPEDDSVVIDFNKAHNPPCAFTPYATCPLPPPQNHLKVAIQAGERYTPIPGQEH